MAVVASNKDVLDIVLQLIVLVVPIVISWFIRTYVKGTVSEKNLAAIVRLSNSAIDFVENLDNNKQLNVPPGAQKGVEKLKLAANWLEGELNRAGIKMTDEEAQKWISSEFQKRVGDIRPVTQIAEVTHSAVDLILNVERTNMVELPPEVDRIAYLAGLAADWSLAQLAMKKWTNISREEALTWARAELVQRLQGPVGEAPAANPLAKLAQGAVEFLQQLKAGGRLAVQPGAAGENIEADVATAWLLTEAAKQGLTVTSSQIAEAIANVLPQLSGGPG